MADTFIQLPPDSTGKQVRAFSGTVGPNTVYEQAFVLCDSSMNIIGVLNASPAGTEYGLVTRNIPSGTQAVSAASLPLPSGAATSANQPGFGPAGTPAANVSSVQGVAGMTAVKVDGSAATQPVSGAVTANQGGAPWSENVSQFGGSAVATGTGVSGAGVPRVTVSSDSFPATQPVSGTVTANQGAAPWSDNVSQFGGSAVVTGAGAGGAGIPRVTVSSDSSLSVSNFPGTQPVSGTVTAQQPTYTALNAQVVPADANAFIPGDARQRTTHVESLEELTVQRLVLQTLERIELVLKDLADSDVHDKILADDDI